MLGWVLILSLMAAIGYAQQPPAAAAPAPAPAAHPAQRLSLADALDLARANSPDYRTVLNDRWSATALERSSLLSLVTPTASIGGGFRRTAQGTSFVTGIPTPFTSPANTGASWQLQLNYSLSGATIANRGFAAAQARATDADVSGALTTIETTVRAQYLILLQARAQVDLAQRSLARSQDALTLAQARYTVGQGTLIEVRRAEVDSGTAAVNLLTAQQTVGYQTLVLFQDLGVPAPEGTEIVPTDTFAVVAPTYDQDQLIKLALDENPGLKALRAREASARWSTRGAYSEYMPSFNLSASYGGFRQSFDALGDPADPAYKAPYSSSGRSPWSMTAYISMPIYDAFSRATDIQRARAQEDDLRQSIRARELLVRASVTNAYGALIAAYQKIALQDASKKAADEALDLATQRYRVGSGTYLELVDARLAADQADANYVSAVYDYHKAVATLENAVGRPLR